MQTIFDPVQLGPLRLPNRVVKAATYESMARGGLVTPELITWHRAIAEGGTGLSTLAYAAVSPEGRTFRDQLLLRDEARDGLAAFSDAIHDAGAKASIQIGHAGWFADPRASPPPRPAPIGPRRQFSPHAGTFSRAASAEDLSRLVHDYARGARLVKDCGFDAVEVHLGHGYLLSQFLSPYHNHRRDQWGGSAEKRALFPRQVLSAVREAVGPGVAVIAKLNMVDGFRGGLSLPDSLTAARLIESDGSVDAFELTAGHTTRAPFFLLRGDSPSADMVRLETNPTRKWMLRLAAPVFLRSQPFTPAFLRPLARTFLGHVKTPLILLGGLVDLETMNSAIAEGFAAVALGRALVRDPALVHALRDQTMARSRCVPCNRCIALTGHQPTRCVLDD